MSSLISPASTMRSLVDTLGRKHSYFTPKSWRPFVQAAVKELLDAAEEKGEMDIMRDLATPLPGQYW